MDKAASENTLEIGRFRRVMPVNSAGWQARFIVAIGIAIAVCEHVFAYHNLVYVIVIALGLSLLIYFLLSALQTAHFWTIYLLFPLWFLFFAWFYLRQVKRPPAPWGRQPLSGMLPAGG